MNSILNQIFVFSSKYFKLFIIIEIEKLVAGFAAIRMNECMVGWMIGLPAFSRQVGIRREKLYYCIAGWF